MKSFGSAACPDPRQPAFHLRPSRVGSKDVIEGLPGRLVALDNGAHFRFALRSEDVFPGNRGGLSTEMIGPRFELVRPLPRLPVVQRCSS